MKRLLDTKISLQQIRAAIQHLRDRGNDDLAQVTLMSDGVSVYECTSTDEVVDLLQGGEGVFGIALGRVWREVEGTCRCCPRCVPRMASWMWSPCLAPAKTTWPGVACAVAAKPLARGVLILARSPVILV